MGKKNVLTYKHWTYKHVWNVTHFQVGNLPYIVVLSVYRDCTTRYNVTIKVSSWTLQVSQMRPLSCLATSRIKGQDMEGHISKELIPQL
jgi:hypothetical protein